jgi:hypothetical protein
MTSTRVAEMVVPGRCSCCGHKLIQWTPQEIVDAALKWAKEHDGFAPKQRDWAAGTPDHPAHTAVYNTFGTWKRFIYATGLPYPKITAKRTWSKDLIADAMIDWLFRHGSFPTSSDWERGGYGYPSNRTVYDFFASWNAAKAYAGAVVKCRNCGDPLSPGQTIWCSDRCRRTYRPAAAVTEVEERACAGCGGEMDNHTKGCKTCADRHHGRRRNRSPQNSAVPFLRPSPSGVEANVAQASNQGRPSTTPRRKPDTAAAQTRRAA